MSSSICGLFLDSGDAAGKQKAPAARLSRRLRVSRRKLFCKSLSEAAESDGEPGWRLRVV